ncbi:MAG: ECF transporter S component, partial [Ruminococcus sp.]|nr:ECF transporter S component [Ruminococcus sp.]
MKTANEKVHLLTLTGVLTALTTVATIVIQIPTPTKGYVNLGDVFVNISAWVLGGMYGAAAGGIGSALADIITGYAFYAPATLIIKALMAFACFKMYNV